MAILAGGLATRLRPLTETTPKSLVEVAGRPFAEHQLELLRQQGVTDVVMCVGHLGAPIRAALGHGEGLGLRITYVEDGPALLGTGGALRKALPHLGAAFLVIYGDSYLECDYQEVAAAFLSSGKQGLMTVFHNQHRWDRSNIHFNSGAIVAYDKNTSDPLFEHVDYGLGGFRADALAGYPPDRAFDLAEVHRDLIARGQLYAHEVQSRFFEIGSPEGLRDLREKLSQRAT